MFDETQNSEAPALMTAFYLVEVQAYLSTIYHVVYP